ncbi:MAG: response regulator [Alphaproteobacteria bacterium]|nr:response regulator [Alphaproteobacteria bacterium]
MEILSPSQRFLLLEYLAVLRHHLNEWLIVEAKLADGTGEDMTSAGVGELLQRLFPGYEGRILICNKTEVLMVIKWGTAESPTQLTKKVRAELPENTCEMITTTPTREGLRKIELMIAPPAAGENPFYKARLARRENIFLLADDDMYIRSLTKVGLKGLGTVIEAGEGTQAVAAYKAHNPDILLLDIHMPGLSGQEVLEQVKAWDPSAYVIMLSADSSRENVQWTHQHGAKGFLTKPFNKAKLLEWVDACPTIK